MGPEAPRPPLQGSLGPVFPGSSENVPYLAAEVSAISQISTCLRLRDSQGQVIHSLSEVPGSLQPSPTTPPPSQYTKLPWQPAACLGA